MTTPPTAADLMRLIDRHAAHVAAAENASAAGRDRAVKREIDKALDFRTRIRTEVDRLHADRPAPHLLPLLNLTADEVDALIDAARVEAVGNRNAVLHAALDKLTTTEETRTDDFRLYLAGQLRDPEVRAAYEAERDEDDDEVIQFGHPRWGL